MLTVNSCLGSKILVATSFGYYYGLAQFRGWAFRFGGVEGLGFRVEGLGFSSGVVGSALHYIYRSREDSETRFGLGGSTWGSKNLLF